MAKDKSNDFRSKSASERAKYLKDKDLELTLFGVDLDLEELQKTAERMFGPNKSTKSRGR